MLLCASLALCPVAAAAELLIAVASNFAAPMQDLARSFEESTRHAVTMSAGSTGKHYAQIVNGAPFDLFFAADAERPARLEAEGRALPGTRFTYATGRLVLWSPDPGRVDAAGEVLKAARFRFLAIANPGLAPYGRAAQEALQALGLWVTLEQRLVRGENVGQTYQFVHSGNAELGLVAASQVHRPGAGTPGSSWTVPQHLYAPIEQQAVLLRDSPAGREFLAFVRSAEALRIIEDHGYLAP